MPLPWHKCSIKISIITWQTERRKGEQQMPKYLAQKKFAIPLHCVIYQSKLNARFYRDNIKIKIQRSSLEGQISLFWSFELDHLNF